jgi:hypothetical protein
MIPKEAIVVFSILLMGIWIYLLILGKIGQIALVSLFLGTILFMVAASRMDDISGFFFKSKGLEAKLELEGIRKDVFATADAVRSMSEAAAEIQAFNLSQANRLSGDDHIELLNQQRIRLIGLLEKIGTEPEKMSAIVAPVTSAIENDLRHDIARVVNPIIQSIDEVRSLHNEIHAELRKVLRESEIGSEEANLRTYLEGLDGWNSGEHWNEEMAARVQRLSQFRRTGELD